MVEVHVSITGVAVLAVILILFLVGLLFYLYPASNKKTTIPGPNISDEKEGNLNDVERCGSLAQYLLEIHRSFGDVVAFKYGQPLVVSVANPKYFPPRTQLFDTPDFLFDSWRSLVGDGSFLYAKGLNVFKRRDIIDFKLDFSSKVVYARIFDSLTNELIKKWRGLPEGQHIPLTLHMKGLSIKAVCCMMFGDYFKDDAKVIKLHKAWDLCWSEVVAVGKKEPTKSKSELKKVQQELKSLMEDAIEHQWTSPADPPTLISGLLAASNKDVTSEEMMSDVITLFTVGLQTTCAVLTWSLYFLAVSADAQKELKGRTKKNVVDIVMERAPDSAVAMETVGGILKESVRCSEMFPFCGREEDIDITVEKHLVEKQTPIIEALNVAMKDEKIWADPHKFDPSRFGKKKEAALNPLHFIPFAFGGSRRKPQESLVFMLAQVALLSLSSHFDVSLAGSDIKCDDSNYDGFVVMPTKEEVWVAVATREEEVETIGS